MSQLTIKLSVKADALIAQLQKEIFNRRRKKVSASGVVETLVESGAKSQSDKRFATSWTNLIKDIEKAAKLANTHGSKPSSLSNEEWAIVLSHRSRKGPATTKTSKKRASASKSKTAAKKSNPTKTKVAKSTSRKKSASKVSTAKLAATKGSSKKGVAKKATPAKSPVRKTAAKKAITAKTSKASSPAGRPARRARKASSAKKATTASHSKSLALA